MDIPDYKRQNLPRIVKQLGLTQSALAEQIGLTPGAISKYFAVGETHSGLRPERVEALVQALKQCLAANQTQMDPGVARALGAELDNLLLFEDQTLAAPGGAMPPTASNYLRRAADSEIEDMLVNNRAPGIAVIGPINGGTSSFLNRAFKSIQSFPGAWSRIVHLDTAFPEGEPVGRADLFKYTFRKLGMPEGKLRGDAKVDAGDDVVEDMKSAFYAWAEEEWGSYSRIFLFVDGCDNLFRTGESKATPLALINWLGSLRNEAGGNTAPYNKLTIVVALAGKTWSAGYASPFATQAARVQLRKFSKSEVAEVFDRHRIERSRYSLDEVCELFAGHPFLTQLFAWSMRNEVTEEEATQQAKDLEGAYEAHWERMKSEIRFLVGENNYAMILAAVGDICWQYRAERHEELIREGLNLWQDNYASLRAFGLIDGTKNKPEVCEFYQKAIEQELDLTAISKSRATSHAR